MKVSKSWLKELVDLKTSIGDIERLLPLRTIGTKEITDDFIELDMKGYNRADLLSMRGVAYEVAAITDSQVKFDEPDPKTFEWNYKNLAKLKAQVEDQSLIPFYCLVKIERLKVEKSKEDWIKKLADSGMRSVNNIADVTNLVMLEYGQPFHAFDAKDVKDESIIVREAKDGEELITLDQKLRKLTNGDILITDKEKVLGLAGVMGGKNSEISDNTTTILLEAAIFDPKSLRKTATRLALNSEASKRFYHGLTKKRLLQALNAAIKIYQNLGGEVTAMIMVGDSEEKIDKITLRAEKLNSLIGVEISKKQVEEYLEKLYFQVEPKGSGWVVTPPYFRHDIEIEEDLIEEVARMFGYENIPAKPLEGEAPEKIDQSLFELIYNLKTEFVNQGLTEIQTYSFFSTKILDALGFNKNNLEMLVRVANPISSETEYMRNNLWSNLVEKVYDNLKNFDEVAIFEVGKVYKPQENELPEENYHLSVALSNDSDDKLPELYQIFKKVMGKLDFEIYFQKIEKNNPLFHPTRAFKIKINGKTSGFIAEVHPRILDKMGIGKRVAVLDIDLSFLLQNYRETFTPTEEE